MRVFNLHGAIIILCVVLMFSPKYRGDIISLHDYHDFMYAVDRLLRVQGLRDITDPKGWFACGAWEGASIEEEASPNERCVPLSSGVFQRFFYHSTLECMANASFAGTHEDIGMCVFSFVRCYVKRIKC